VLLEEALTTGVPIIKTVNLKADRPSVQEVLQMLEREIGAARREKQPLVKIVHGYGSTGKGGDIRIAVQKRLRELMDSGQIRGCIFGEDWTKSHEETWRLLQLNPELKDDVDLGRRNPGITIVMI
jgi:hypothetical protein